MLLPDSKAAEADCVCELVVFDVSDDCDPPQAMNNRLRITVKVSKHNERVLVNMGPPARFSFNESVLLHVLLMLLRLLFDEFVTMWVQ